MKTRNFGVVSGRICSDIVIEKNNDGSRTVTLELAVLDDFSSRAADTMQLVSLKGFIDAKQKDDGIFGGLYSGALVTVGYSVQNENTTANSKGYCQYLCIEEISIMEIPEDSPPESCGEMVEPELFTVMTDEEKAEYEEKYGGRYPDSNGEEVEPVLFSEMTDEEKAEYEEKYGGR